MKERYVAFISTTLKKAYESLRARKHENRQLQEFIRRAIECLTENAECGTKVPKKLWPKQYKKYGITNLWKYDLPGSWRLVYTIEADEVCVISIILEWFDHKKYERRFGYS